MAVWESQCFRSLFISLVNHPHLFRILHSSPRTGLQTSPAAQLLSPSSENAHENAGNRSTFVQCPVSKPSGFRPENPLTRPTSMQRSRQDLATLPIEEGPWILRGFLIDILPPNGHPTACFTETASLARPKNEGLQCSFRNGSCSLGGIYTYDVT